MSLDTLNSMLDSKEYMDTKQIQLKKEGRLLENVKNELVMPYFMDLSESMLEHFREVINDEHWEYMSGGKHKKGYQVENGIRSKYKYIVLSDTYKSIEGMSEEKIRENSSGNRGIFLGIDMAGSFVEGKYNCRPHMNPGKFAGVEVNLNNHNITPEQFAEKMSLDSFINVIDDKFKEKGMVPDNPQKGIEELKKRIEMLENLKKVMKTF